MAHLRNAIGSIEPYLIRFVKGQYSGSHHDFPFPIRRFQTEELSPKQADFFIQCYDYLVHGVQVKPSQSIIEYIKMMKFANTFGKTIVEAERGGHTSTKNIPEGAVLDLVFLPGNQPYLGWFNSGGDPDLPASLCHDIYHCWNSSKSGCSHAKYSFYDASARFQYAFQVKAAMCKPSSQVTPRDMKLLHSRHLYYVRSVDNGLDLISMFTKTISGDPLTTFSRKNTQVFPQSLRTLEILMRFSLKRSSSDAAEVKKLNDDIKQRCQYLNSNWWDSFMELKGLQSASNYSALPPSLATPVTLSTVHCPLFELASLLLSNSNSMSPDQFQMRLMNEITALSSVLSRYEYRLLSHLDTPQAVDLAELPKDMQSGLLDCTALRYPFRTCPDKDETIFRSPSEVIQQTVAGDYDVEAGWVATMGLDSKGYLSYALRGCDMIASALGASFRQKGTVTPSLLQQVWKLRHQLRVHHLRRYAFGSTAVWSDTDSAVQCFPFFESVCLSLQIRSAIAIVQFSQDKGPGEPVYCLPSLQLLSMLFPKLTPCLLYGGSVKSLLEMKAAQQCVLTGQISGKLEGNNTISFSLTGSQLEELQRQVQLQYGTCGKALQVGVIFRDSRLLAFFNPNQILPFHHIS